VHQDDRRLGGDLGHSEAHRVGPSLPARHACIHLARAQLLREEDRRFDPVLVHNHDDCLDPLGVLEPFQALGEQGPIAQLRKRLRALTAEALTAPGCNKDRPDAGIGHRGSMPRGACRRRAGEFAPLCLP
jgi:hypothetical protein